MADLLECLIQLKALRHSIARLERFVAAAPPDACAGVEAVLDRMLDAERAYARVLPGGGLARAEHPRSPRPAQFAAARRATLDVLQQYSAEDLGRAVDWPGRRLTTVADLVAIMLAHDTDRIGEIQRLARPG